MPDKFLCLHKPALLIAVMALVVAPAGAADKPKEQVEHGSPPQQAAPRAPEAQARDTHAPDRPPPDSGRPAIGPRTTQGLAADAIARSNAP